MAKVRVATGAVLSGIRAAVSLLLLGVVLFGYVQVYIWMTNNPGIDGPRELLGFMALSQFVFSTFVLFAFQKKNPPLKFLMMLGFLFGFIYFGGWISAV